MSIIDTLVTDRTYAQAQRAAYLYQLGWENMTAEEKTEFLTPGIGVYTHDDWNRVEGAVDYLMTELSGAQAALDAYRAAKGIAPAPIFVYNFSVPVLATKQDWTEDDIPEPADQTRYVQNVADITAVITIAVTLPTGTDQLTYLEANALEEALRLEWNAFQAIVEEKQRLVDRAAEALIYSGEVFAGEV